MIKCWNSVFFWLEPWHLALADIPGQLYFTYRHLKEKKISAILNAYLRFSMSFYIPQ